MEAKRAFEHLAGLLGSEFTQSALVGEIGTEMLWTTLLPGFAEARASAFKAWTSIETESAFWREIASANSEFEAETIFATARLRAGVSTTQRIITEFLQSIPSEKANSELLQKLTDAVRDGERNKSPLKAYFSDLSSALGGALESHEAAYVTNGRASIARQYVVLGWIQIGFWLVDSATILNYFERAKIRCPEFAGLKLPETEHTVEQWRGQLGLTRYRGKGKLYLYKTGTLFPDKVLLEELGRIHPNHSMLSKYGSDWDIGNACFWDCLDKARLESNLGE